MVIRGWAAVIVGVWGLTSGCGGSQHPVEDSGTPVATDSGTPVNDAGTTQASRRVILFVWDGLRPDSVTAANTPNLYELAQVGVRFSDNHSTYPTFTMMNAAAFATGSFPGTTGFYGNTLFQPGPTGAGFDGKPVAFDQPVFTEDYAILRDLDAYYQQQLLLVGSLFEAAHTAGLTTVAVGKSGAAFLQDHKSQGYILDEKFASPLSFAKELQGAGFDLPKTTPIAWPDGGLAVSSADPTALGPTTLLADNVTYDPTNSAGSRYSNANQYMMDVYVEYILPQKKPDVTVIWFRNPDATEHNDGPGSANYRDALRSQDALLGQLLEGLALNHLSDSTDVVVVSDHAHSSVAGAQALFPLRGVDGGTMGAPDPDHGFSASGDLRLPDLIHRAKLGFEAYDGSDCVLDPVMTGLLPDGGAVYPTRIEAMAGEACSCSAAPAPCNPRAYTTPKYQVPDPLGPTDVVVASNGGSDYVYVPSHDVTQVQALVRFMQSREEYGPIFVASRYGDLPGTLPLTTVRIEGASQRNPDIVASMNYDETAVVQGMPGTEYENMAANRGMHGSFSPIDVHNTLIAVGPHFRAGFVDTLPSANVDVAPTLAQVMGLSMPQADGRPLLEALTGGEVSGYQVTQAVVASTAPATGLVHKLPTQPDGLDVDTARDGSYRVELHTKALSQGGKSYTYFDSAKALRP